ncbi:perlucin-like [Uranotaenia lowii]|uniref:perlucin-like n=1 Tax=Uranotaenia lowii TaxID=190385 RepID=UPI00247AD2D9|nr:perlucin-like [Uranotaenia lowii]
MFSKSLIALVGLVGIISCQNTTSCPQENRYVVRSDAANFFQAWERCRELGLRLATVNSAQDSDSLAEAIAASKTKAPWWIAATDLGNSPFNYTWISTNQALEGYTNFAPDQPDNNKNKGTENCIEVGRYGSVTWNDWQCTGQIGYICERHSDDECSCSCKFQRT